MLAGCGSTPAGQAAPAAPPVPAARLSLATSAQYQDGSWAVLVMGGSAAAHNNFWQVFVRPGQTRTWKLATPPGAASNGGITVAAEGGPVLAAAVRPSQDLSFSPLASSGDNGAKWAQSGLLDARLAGYPDALAATPGGGLIALTKTGDVELRAHPGGSWTRLASEHAVVTAAGRGCRARPAHLGRLQPLGRPGGGGDCSRAGEAGIFRLAGGHWSRTGPALPAALAGSKSRILQMARRGRALAALLVAGHGTAARLLGAWSNPGRHLVDAVRSPTSWARRVLVGVVRQWRARRAPVGRPGRVGQRARRRVAGAARAARHASRPLVAGLPWPRPRAAASRPERPGRPAVRLDAVLGGSGWSRSQVINVSIPYGSSG